MNFRAFFITNFKSSVLMKPRNTTFNYPTIYSQTTAVFRSSLCQKRFNAFLTKFNSMWFRIVTTITQYTVRLATRATDFTCHRRNAINQRQQLCNIMPIGSSQFNCQWKPISICYQMLFRAFFTAIRGVWAGFCPPKTARTEEESTMAREKSIWLAWCSLFNSVRYILSHTPSFCQSRNLRQQVIPQPHPISLGKSSHPIPVFRTNKIPVRAFLSGTGFRPGYLNLRFFFGSIGSIISHNPSSSIGFAMSNLHVFWLLMLSVINVNFSFILLEALNISAC